MLFILCIPMVFSTDEIAYRKVSSPLVVTKMFFFSLFVTCNLGMASRYAPHDPIGVDLIRFMIHHLANWGDEGGGRDPNDMRRELINQ